MCLIALAHRATERFPLILAANRDEDYDRASHDAHFWPDFPDVLGGRDGGLGGTWLAITRQARFAAVTNLHGAVRRSRSRGLLVSDYVTRGVLPEETHEYAGFHLIAGQVGGEAAYVTPDARRTLAPGVHGFSNAPSGEAWPKTDYAVEQMQAALSIEDPQELVETMMRFLTTPRGTERREYEIFIADERYGTRASTVIVATDETIFFSERSFTRGGVAQGDRRNYRVSIGS
ncbi:MAG TPA: NRDE family protein [Thermoanaerobaculia bacterium]|nr:NRDE family protein [Thermoanaerobaculia bacterium]